MIEGMGVLLRGPSGSGKSDLALRLIEDGGRLVADDWAELEVRDGRLVARAPDAIAGLFEARGLGVLRLDAVPEAALGLVVELVGAGEVERLPAKRLCDDLPLALPLFRLHAFEPSAPAKVRLAARLVAGQVGSVA